MLLTDDLNPGAASSAPTSLTAFDDALYFSIATPATGRELWRADAHGLTRVSDINPGPGSSDPTGLTVLGGALYFSATDGGTLHGRELWRWDGLRLTGLTDINPGPGSSNPTSLVVFDDTLYFQASDAGAPGDFGAELWRWDAESEFSSGEVRLAVDINPGAPGSFPANPIVFAGALFVQAQSAAEGTELWRVLDPDLVKRPPVVDAGLDVRPREGGLFHFHATFDDFGTGHTATIDWGDGTVDTGVVTPTTRGHGVVSGSHAYRDDGVYTTRVVLTDGDGLSGADERTATVINVAPEATLVGPPVEIRGLAVAFPAWIADPGTLDTHEVAWDFGDGMTIGFQAATDAGALAPPHVFADAGTYTVTLTVRDDDGGMDTVTATIVIKAVDLVADPCDPDQRALFIAGTPDDDTVRVLPAPGGLEVWIDGVGHGVFAHEGRIIVKGFAGDDDIAIADGLGNEVALFGDAGDDRLKAGAGSALLMGGDGNDWLVGGAGPDILIGGPGTDRLTGTRGDDLLIAGWTVYDDNVRALCTLWHEAGQRPLRTPVARLTRGADGMRLRAETVVDDGGKATLGGGSGPDWFLAATGGKTRDQLTDRPASEALTALKALAPAPGSRRPVIDGDRSEDDTHAVGCGDRGPSRWARDFVLDLGGHGAKRDIRIVPGASQAKEFSRV